MTIGLVLVCIIVNMIARCIIFNKRDIKWFKALIPGYNKYILGKLSGSKKLAILNFIMHPLFNIYLFGCFVYEMWIIQNYSIQANMPTNVDEAGKIFVEVPKNIADIAIYSKYGLIALAVITIVVWSIMMCKFTIKNKKSIWLVILWALCPVIPYVYFAAINDVEIDGKIYTMKRVEK